MRTSCILTLFFSALSIAQNNYHPGQYIDVDNRKFDIQIKEYNFDDDITSLDYKENDNEQAFSLPIDQVELFTYKKNREIFIFREVNLTKENGEESYENTKKILMQLISTGQSTGLLYRKLSGKEEFFVLNFKKEAIQLIENDFKKTISTSFNLDEKELDVYEFNKLSLILLINEINAKTIKPAGFFGVVDDAPIFNGCEEFKDSNDRLKCFHEKFNSHFSRNFHVPEVIKNLFPNERLRILLSINIDETGRINLLNVRAPHPAFEPEIKRVFNLFPQIIPGKNNGVAVKVNYSIPFNLILEDDSIKKSNTKKYDPSRLHPYSTKN
jgi:hypothetical protein